MRREGRIHGCNVRVAKRQWGYGYGEKVCNHPTNQSKCTVKRPLIQSVAHVALTEHAYPAQKSMGKVKHAFKAKDLDITRNHLMQDWRIHVRDQNAADEDSDCSDADCEHWDSDDHTAPGRGSGMQQEEYEYRVAGTIRDRVGATMVVPIESLLSRRKRKGAPKARLPGQQQFPPTVGDNGVDNTLESADDSDEFESWWGLGHDGGEDVSDDWFLITEDEGFVA